MIQDIYTPEGLDAKTEQWIKTTLSNDEYASDKELVEHFIHEGKLSEQTAKLWVSRRAFYLNNIVLL